MPRVKPLEWRVADSGDWDDLRGFTCAHPARLSRDPEGIARHPRPYQVIVEIEVQELQPPLDDDRVVLLGYDEVGLAAVVIYELPESGDSPPWPFVNLMARAGRAHGLDYGDQILREVIARTRPASSGGFERMGLYTKIHPNNRACRQLLERQGFNRIPADDDLEWWGITFD